MTEPHVDPPEMEHGDEPELGVHIGICELDGVYRSANAEITVDNDAVLAEALVDCLRAIAAHRGSGLQLALARRFDTTEERSNR